MPGERCKRARAQLCSVMYSNDSSICQVPHGPVYNSLASKVIRLRLLPCADPRMDSGGGATATAAREAVDVALIGQATPEVEARDNPEGFLELIEAILGRTNTKDQLLARLNRPAPQVEGEGERGAREVKRRSLLTSSYVLG